MLLLLVCLNITQNAAAPAKDQASIKKTVTPAIDISGKWKSGQFTYTLIQIRNIIVCEGTDGSLGHANGEFTNENTFSLNWSTITLQGTLQGDTITWSNGTTWTRTNQTVSSQTVGGRPPGRSTVAWTILDLPAGQSDGSSDPDCPPAKCGIIAIRHIPFSGPQKEIIIDEVTMSYYVANGNRSHWEICPDRASLETPNGLTPMFWDCPYYARFDRLSYAFEQDGKGFVASVRFRNWANHSRKGKFTIKYW